MRFTQKKLNAILWSALILVTAAATILSGSNIAGGESLDLSLMEYTLFAVLILWLAVVSWRLKVRLRARMEQGLGRQVEDGELVSISSWMKIPDQAARAAKEADNYDFD